MRPAGVLLDAGPLVALLSHGDAHHERARRLFAESAPPFRCCEAVVAKYADRPISFADACLIRCAEAHQEARIATFDSDFAIHRWGRNRRFEIL